MTYGIVLVKVPNLAGLKRLSVRINTYPREIFFTPPSLTTTGDGFFIPIFGGTDEMKIREIQQQDDAILAMIIKDSLEYFQLNIPGTAYFDPQLTHLYQFYQASAKRDYFVLLDQNDQVVGGAGFGEYHDQIAELQKLYISPEAQGRRGGYALINQVELAAANAGYMQLYLESHHALKAALHLYQNVNFTQLKQPLLPSPHTTMDRFFIKTINKKDEKAN